MKRNTSLLTLLTCIVTLIFTNSIALAVNIPNEPNALKQIKQIKKTQDLVKKKNLGDKAIPRIPAVPEIPEIADPAMGESTIQTLSSLDEIEKVNNTLKQVEEARRIQPLATLTVSLTNSKKFKKLEVSVTAVLSGDIDTAENLLEQYTEEMKTAISQELSILTDKELTWEQEGRHILDVTTRVFNEKAKKPFLKMLLYSEFDLQ